MKCFFQGNFSFDCFTSRKLDGKSSEFKENVNKRKSEIFPYPVSDQESVVELSVCGRGDVARRPESEYLREIADLQAKLHEATAQIEQKNSELVRLDRESQLLSRNLKDQSSSLNQFRNENLRLKRKFDSLEGLPAQPRPGPAFKAWEDMSARNMKRASEPIQQAILKTAAERDVDPVKLSAEILFR